MRNPFVGLNANTSANFNISEGAAQAELRNDRELNLKHSMTDIHTFWLSLNNKYSNITKKERMEIFYFFPPRHIYAKQAFLKRVM